MFYYQWCRIKRLVRGPWTAIKTALKSSNPNSGKALFFAIEPVVTSSMTAPAMIRRKLANGHAFPILMYHSIPASIAKGTNSYYDLRVSLENFRRQMQFLRDHRFNVIDLKEYIQARENGEDIPHNSVAITFDDGYRDNYLNAFPVLKIFRFPATVFLVTDLLDGGRPRFFAGETGLGPQTTFLSWSEIKEMSEAGINFGSHTVTHPDLQTLSDSEFRHELSGSKKRIEQQLWKPVDCFCYPYAFKGGGKQSRFRLRTAELLDECGYKLGVTTTIGRNSHNGEILFLERIPMHVNDSIGRFSAKLDGAYDWVGSVQALAKFAKKKANKLAV
jgi:peptidoglycan/xylan/chitin deacetylase (PgdA/CDA1 family)